MKTSELAGTQLDYWVAKAEGHEVDPPLAPGQAWPQREELGRKYEPNYICFSTSWEFGGPIIEREGIAIYQTQEGWMAVVPNKDTGYSGEEHFPNLVRADWFSGPSPLIAAMRALVASKFGQEVPAL